MKRYNDCPQIVRDFLTYHETIKGQSQLTISEYYLDLRMFLRFMKLMRKKLIFIESFAKVSSPTLSGKLLYKYADRFYVQWEEMLSFYPDAIYKGGIY